MKVLDHVMPREKRWGALDSCFGLVGPHQQSIPQLLSLASPVYKERSTCGSELMRLHTRTLQRTVPLPPFSRSSVFLPISKGILYTHIHTNHLCMSLHINITVIRNPNGKLSPQTFPTMHYIIQCCILTAYYTSSPLHCVSRSVIWKILPVKTS